MLTGYLVGIYALADFDDSLFRTFERELYLKSVTRLIKPAVLTESFNRTTLEGLCGSLTKLGRLCKSVQDLEYLGLLQRVVIGTLNDPIRAHQEHRRLYDKLGTYTPGEFAHFIDPTNYTALLLILHMLLLDYIMDSSVNGNTNPSASIQQRDSADFHKVMMVTWLEKIVRRLPASHVPYAEWPIRYARRLCRGDAGDVSELEQEQQEPLRLEMYGQTY